LTSFDSVKPWSTLRQGSRPALREIHAIVAQSRTPGLRYSKQIIFNIHKTMLPEPAKDLKPTVGFQARFFWEGQIFWKILTDNGLQKQKTIKT
jgi:hypothetical protein